MYKIYESGRDFLWENRLYLATHPLETVYIGLNALMISPKSDVGFLIRVWDGDDVLFAVRVLDYPMDIFGSERLCGELAQAVAERGFTFSKLLGFKETCEAFITAYERVAGGSHEITRAMDVMYCQTVSACDCSGVQFAAEEDRENLSEEIAAFCREELGECCSAADVKKQMSRRIDEFALLRCDGKIASIAQKTRESELLTAISGVYTVPAYRRKGLARKTVTFLTEQIVGEGKIAYLFVEQGNSAAKRLYEKIGYKDAFSQYEIKYVPAEKR